jgi:hypothetical protein
MKLKSLLIVIACLAVASAVAYWLKRPSAPPAADARLGQPLAASATVEKATGFTLSDGGKSVELARNADGVWVVSNYHDLPADFSKLSRLVGDLTGTKIERLVTTNANLIARLEFKDTKLALKDGAGAGLWAVTLGKNAENGGRFVRFGDENKAYLARLNAWLDAEAKNWADSGLVKLQSDDVARFEITFAEGGTVTASREKKEDAFTAVNPPAGRRLKTATLTTLLNSMTSLRFSDTTAPDDPEARDARAHAHTIKLTTFDGKTVTIALGRRPERVTVKKPDPAPVDGGPAAIIGDVAAGPTPDTAAVEKILEPVTETTPAGQPFVVVASSDPSAPINAAMAKRAFKVADYTFSNLPKSVDDLYEEEPKPAAESAPASPEPALPPEAP